MDEPRPGRPRTVTDRQVEEVITRTLESEPKGATHWSTRSMAAELGLTSRRCIGSGRRSGSSRTANRRGSCPRTRSSWTRSRMSSGCIWRRPSGRSCCAWMRRARSRHWIGPPRSCRCCPASPSAPPTTTSALAPQACMPLWISRPGRCSGRCTPVTARSSSRSSCRRSTRPFPNELAVHLVLDNASTHKTPAIQRWLLAHPRFQLHFTPTSSSWLNLVERWFSELTTKKLRRGTHRSVRELNARHPCLDRHLERESAALRLDQNRRADPRRHPGPTAPGLMNHDTSAPTLLAGHGYDPA